jgi:cell division protein FtsQ
LGKKQTHKTRRNRFKKDTRQRYERLWRHMLTVGKFCGLLVLLLSFSAMFVAGYAAVISSDYFRTQNIEIKGRQRLTHEQVLTQAGLREGDNLLAVNLHLVRKKLLTHPWVSHAQVSREIPGTITVKIQEYQPLAVIDLGQRFLMNVHGRIFKEFGSEDSFNLPLVTGISYADISLGEDPLSPALESVLQVLRNCQDSNGALPVERVERVHFDPEMGLSITQREDQRLIKLGFDHYETKFIRLKRLLRHLQRSGQWQASKEIDLNNPDRVVVQLQAEQGALGGI